MVVQTGVGPSAETEGRQVIQPKVAFLMSVYAQERPQFLKLAIESMLNQSYPNRDIHIFQDGPLGEELLGVLSDYAQKNDRLFLYAHPVNRGLAVCLNEMIARLQDSYDYFARMDSDDFSFPDRIEKQVKFLEEHPDIDIVGGGIADMDESGQAFKRVAYPEAHDEIVRFFRKRNPMAHVTVMYRRSYFQKAGLYPPVRLEDGLYWMQGMLAGCRFHNIPDVLLCVRRTDDFLKRRSGLQKAWTEFKIKCTINHRLRLGPASYVYALAIFVMQLLPIPLKQILYDLLR